MEEACLRRFDPALLQNQQVGSDRPPLETQLRFYFHPHPRRVGDENFPARADGHGQPTLILSRLARRSYPFLAGGVRFRRHVHQRDRDYDLRQQKIFRRNFRVRHPPFALADLMSEFEKLCEIVAHLRAPGGCPWDREQTHESLLPALIEEAYEVAEAARAKNDKHFREELGDLLLLVVMHAEIAQESGRFNIDSVIAEITEKLIRRHPHVFGTVAAGVSPANASSNAAGTAATTA